MLQSYPLPESKSPYIERVQELYRIAFQIEITHAEAKEILERVMQFIYLVYIEDAIHPKDEEAGRTENPPLSPC